MAQEPTIKFKWVTTSPEPHDVTMRNSLEPLDVFVEVDVPVEEKYLANYKLMQEHHLKLLKHREAEIKAELSADDEKVGKHPGPYPDNPVLTVEGMRYIVSQLSGSNSTFEPEVEEEWDEESGDDVSWEDDDDFSDEEDIDWEDE